MTRRARAVAVFGMLAILSACTGNSPIPPGAQQVRVSVTEAGVQLSPSSVPQGDVYLVLDAGAVNFVERKATEEATPGPLTDEDIARIRAGDTQGTSQSGLEAGNCDPDQNSAGRGQLGPCGNVMLVKVLPGRYLVVAGTAEGPGALSEVLEVVP